MVFAIDHRMAASRILADMKFYRDFIRFSPESHRPVTTHEAHRARRLHAFIIEKRSFYKSLQENETVPSYESACITAAQQIPSTGVVSDRSTIVSTLLAQIMQDISFSASRGRSVGEFRHPVLRDLTMAEQEELVELVKDEFEEIGLNTNETEISIRSSWGIWLSSNKSPQPYLKWLISFTGTMPYFRLLCYGLESGADLERLEFVLKEEWVPIGWKSPEEKTYIKKRRQRWREECV